MVLLVVGENERISFGNNPIKGTENLFFGWIISQCAGIHAVVVTLDLELGLLIVVNLMFSSASFSLCGPSFKEQILVENMAVVLRPFSEGFPASSVGGGEAAQLPELLRDFR